ncbi:hypothetical protein [Enterococcus sp. DIV1420a]
MRKDVLEGVLRHIINDIQPNYIEPWPNNTTGLLNAITKLVKKLELSN